MIEPSMKVEKAFVAISPPPFRGAWFGTIYYETLAEPLTNEGASGAGR